MTKYDIALSVLPSLVSNTEYTNVYTIAHRAFEIAAAFEEVSKQYQPLTGPMDDVPSMYDDLGMSLEPWDNFAVTSGDQDIMIDLKIEDLGVSPENFQHLTAFDFTGYGCTDNPSNYFQTDIIRTQPVVTEYKIAGNSDLAGLNISLNPI